MYLLVGATEGEAHELPWMYLLVGATEGEAHELPASSRARGGDGASRPRVTHPRSDAALEQQ